MDFIKKHPCISVSIVGLLAIILDFFSQPIAGSGFLIMFIILTVGFALIGIFLIGINITSMILVLSDKSAAGVILSLPIGGFGAMVGLLFNPSYKCKKAIKVIFSVQLWFVIWVLFSYILFSLDYYEIRLF